MAWEHVGDAVSASSLMGGWLPVAVQILTALALIRAIGRRTRRWWLVVAPLLLALAVTAAVGAHWAFTTLGMASEPAPFALWAWVGSCVLALGIVVATWRGHGWARRNLSVITASMEPGDGRAAPRRNRLGRAVATASRPGPVQPRRAGAGEDVLCGLGIRTS